jgi:hypothetical protein
MTRCLALSALVSVGLLLGGCGTEGDPNPHTPTPGAVAIPQMVPETAFTPGTSNEVAWTVVEEGAGAKAGLAYFAQAAPNEAFTGNLWESGWISARSHEFTGLQPRIHGAPRRRDIFLPGQGPSRAGFGIGLL